MAFAQNASSPLSAPSPADGHKSTFSLHELDNVFTLFADFFTLACFGVFIVLIGYYIWWAFKKWVTWLPHKAFALSGVTVQIIVWWTTLSNIFNDYDGELDDMMDTHQLVVSGRVVVCVFVGYLLPGMAAPSIRAFLALAITICAQLGSELLLLRLSKHDEEAHYYRPSMRWSKIANLILFICNIVLGLILCCTILVSKTIQSLLRQIISAILSITEEGEFQFSNERMVSNSWYDFGDEVLMSWFVARACQADYVISI
ncbi:hypothetical protein SUGI_0443910 [Cryptomeria japonica]|nr:hypothetical protein SUGI_0443910 [Cryptomeria japonica]